MKNLIISSIVAISMLSLVSCSHDNEPTPVQEQSIITQTETNPNAAVSAHEDSVTQTKPDATLVSLEEGVGEGLHQEIYLKEKEGVGEGLSYEPQTVSNSDLTGIITQPNGRQVNYKLVFTVENHMDVYLDYTAYNGEPDRMTEIVNIDHVETPSYISFYIDGYRYFYEK